MTDAREIAQIVTAAFHESERQYREAKNPVVESPADEPTEVGKGNHVPNAGQQPNQLPTRERLIQLAEQAGDHKLALQLKNEELFEKFEHTHGPQAK